MVRIYKYKVEPSGNTFEDKFKKILKVDWQGDDLCIWALIDDNSEMKTLNVYIIPTGVPFDLKLDLEYLDTIKDDLFIWHIFYELKE